MVSDSQCAGGKDYNPACIWTMSEILKWPQNQPIEISEVVQCTLLINLSPCGWPILDQGASISNVDSDRL